MLWSGSERDGEGGRKERDWEGMYCKCQIISE